MRAEETVEFSYPKNVRWECQRCARCCGDVEERKRQITLLLSDVSEITLNQGLSPEKFTEPIVGYEPYIAQMRKKADGTCLFLEGKTCRIYLHRPLVCRFFPVWLEKDGSAFIFNVTHECSGLGKGKIFGREHFVTLLEQALRKRG